MSKQAIIFDYGRVLSAGAPEWVAAIDREFGIPSSTWRPLLAGADGVETLLGGKPFSTHDMVPILAARLAPVARDFALPAATKMCTIFTDPVAGHEIEPVLAILKALHRAGALVGVLSNGPSDAATTVMAPLLGSGYVDASVISGRDGVGKPSLEAFALMLDRLGVEARDAWFVDDDPKHVEAGMAAGITSVVFDGDALKLEAELRATGLDW